jgi:hypothetical protein
MEENSTSFSSGKISVYNNLIDVLLLLPLDHPAVPCLRLLFSKLPKFSFNTPIPYNQSCFQKLHKENVTTVSNFVFRHKLPVPSTLGQCDFHPHVIFNSYSLNNISNPSFYPFMRLKRLLNIFHLVMLPADKTKVIVILQESILNEEMNIHLSEKDTYKILEGEEHNAIYDQQLSTVRSAATFFKLPKLIPSNPSKRYIYFLPKVHKKISDWRSELHPKMRPIICDVGSITYSLSRYLLTTLQQIERNICTTVTSSLAVRYDLNKVNIPRDQLSSITMTTFDVESLFTRIPHDHLMQIVNIQLQTVIIDRLSREKFMFYLEK